MPFTVSASAYKGGDYLYGGLSNFGSSLASGIQDWQKRQQSVNQFEGQLELMRGMTTTNEKGEQVPILDDKAYERYKAISGQQKAALGGELFGAIRVAHALAKDQTVSFTPTPGGPTYKVPPTAAVHGSLEQQRLALAARPKTITPYEEERLKREDIRIGMAAKTAKRTEQKETPEYKFNQATGLKPRDVLNLQHGYQAVDASGKPIKNLAIGPDGKPVGEGDIAQIAGYVPTTPAYREKEVKIKAGQVLASGKKSPASYTTYVPDPSGEFLNYGDQHIPYSHVRTIQNRAAQVSKWVREALGKGGDPDKISKQLESMGYDPAQMIPNG